MQVGEHDGDDERRLDAFAKAGQRPLTNEPKSTDDALADAGPRRPGAEAALMGLAGS
jgi:hypothetical protein